MYGQMEGFCNNTLETSTRTAESEVNNSESLPWNRIALYFGVVFPLGVWRERYTLGSTGLEKAFSWQPCNEVILEVIALQSHPSIHPSISRFASAAESNDSAKVLGLATAAFHSQNSSAWSSAAHFLLLAVMERRSRLRNVVLSREPEPPLPAAFRATGERGDDLLFSAPPEWWSLCAVDGRPLPPLLPETHRRFWSLQSPEEVGRLDEAAGIFDELPPRDKMRVFSESATWCMPDC